MTQHLRWRDAEHSDREGLQTFLCTRRQPIFKRSRRTPRPREWEWVAQGILRSLRPPAHGGELILIGEDQLGLAAVTSTEDQDGPGVVFVRAVGVHTRLRGTGGDCADELFQELTDRLIARADNAGLARVTLQGNVHRRNAASQFFLHRNGWEHLSGEDYGDYERWIWTAEIADPAW